VLESAYQINQLMLSVRRFPNQTRDLHRKLLEEEKREISLTGE
jgi:hypothetical protein